MSNQLFPSTVQSLVREGRLLGISIAPQGSGTPLLVSGQGVASVARNSAGNFTITLQNQFRSLVNVLADVQLASVSQTTASYVWTDATDTDSVQFLAGPAFPGTLGNNLKVVVATGAALASTVTYSAGITTVTLTINTGTTTPALLKTYVNTTAVSTLGGILSIGTTSGTTPFSVFLASTPLSGGASGAPQVLVQSANVTGAVASGVTAQTITVQVQDASTGAATDIAAAAGNLINLTVFCKNEGGLNAPGAV